MLAILMLVAGTAGSYNPYDHRLLESPTISPATGFRSYSCEF